MWRRTLDGWGYSPLNQINRQNADELALVWKRDMAARGVQEATPLVYKGTMFLPNPSDVTQAINAANGDVIWEYRRPVPSDLTTYLSGAPLKNRNLAIYGNTIIDLSADDWVYAIDARTGRPSWQPQARRRVDASKLRPGVEPAVHRHVRHLAGAEVSARRQR